MTKFRVIIFLVGVFFILLFIFLDLPVHHLSLSSNRPSLNFYGLLGYSPAGESIVSLVFWGSWQTIVMAVIARLLAISLTFVGTFLSFQNSLMKRAVIILSETFITLPSILIAVALGFTLGSGNVAIILAIGISEWAMNQKWHLSRLSEYANFDFVRYSRLINSSHFFIFKNHFLPYLKQDLLILFFLYMPGSILTVAALEFLGLSAYSGVNGLGFQIAAYKDYIFVTPHVVISPLLTLVLIVLSLSIAKKKLEKLFFLKHN